MDRAVYHYMKLSLMYIFQFDMGRDMEMWAV